MRARRSSGTFPSGAPAVPKKSRRYLPFWHPTMPATLPARRSLLVADLPYLKNSEKTGLLSARIVAALPWLWLALVVVSQTSAAGRVAEALFSTLFGSGGPGGGYLHLVLQKGYHVFLFFTFGWLLSLPAAGRHQASCLLWVFVVGSGAEALQLWAPGRGPRLSDALLNLAAGAAAVVGQAWLKRLSRQGSCR